MTWKMKPKRYESLTSYYDDDHQLQLVVFGTIQMQIRVAPGYQQDQVHGDQLDVVEQLENETFIY